MDSSGVPASRMDWDSATLPDAWQRFVQHVKLIFTGPLSEETQCSYLLLWVGERGRDIYNTWQLSDEEAKRLTTYLDRFEQYFMPKTNTIARYKFNERLQGEGESFEHFVTELKLLVKQCGYVNCNEMVQDRIVFATSFPQVREKLLSQGSDLTLEKAIDIARSYEIAQNRYRFLCLPFGIVSAQDIFQRKINETYEGLNGMAAIVDDILVFGKTKEEHDENLRAMLECTRERGVRLNPEKCVIGATEVSYFGHKLTREGIQPDPKKLQEFKDMPPPENRD